MILNILEDLETNVDFKGTTTLQFFYTLNQAETLDLKELQLRRRED